nr:GTP cyclohydrolase II RibA [Actinomycetales bacterium]
MTDLVHGDVAHGLVVRVTETVLPTRHGVFRMIGYRGQDGVEHVALAMGIGDAASAGHGTGYGHGSGNGAGNGRNNSHGAGTDTGPATHRHGDPLVRLHSECLTGDALGSHRCDCGDQLQAALARIAHEGRGVLVYVRGHEGRGIGLLEKLKAYHLQDNGADTVDANLALGHPADARDYSQPAAILRDLGLSSIRLMSSNPAKENALADLGITVSERTGMFVPEFAENMVYLETKRLLMGHDRPPSPSSPGEAGGVWAELLAGRVPVSSADVRGATLIDRYGPLVATGPHLAIAQMAQSLDGFIATRTGDSAGLSGAEDHMHLHRLRALVDALIVGAGTVIADNPRLTVREVTGPSPTRVVLDLEARIPADSGVLTDGAAPTLWIVAEGVEVPDVGAHVEVVRVPVSGAASRGDDDGASSVSVSGSETAQGAAALEPAAVLELLRERGLGRVLVEGGGRTVSSFVTAGVLDRLYVTTVPVLLGDGVPGVRGLPTTTVAEASRIPARRFRLGDDLVTELILG